MQHSLRMDVVERSESERERKGERSKSGAGVQRCGDDRSRHEFEVRGTGTGRCGAKHAALAFKQPKATTLRVERGRRQRRRLDVKSEKHDHLQ